MSGICKDVATTTSSVLASRSSFDAPFTGLKQRTKTNVYVSGDSRRAHLWAQCGRTQGRGKIRRSQARFSPGFRTYSSTFSAFATYSSGICAMSLSKSSNLASKSLSMYKVVGLEDASNPQRSYTCFTFWGSGRPNMISMPSRVCERNNRKQRSCSCSARVFFEMVETTQSPRSKQSAQYPSIRSRAARHLVTIEEHTTAVVTFFCPTVRTRCERVRDEIHAVSG